MARHHGHDSVRKKALSKAGFPQIFIDKDADFASIKLRPGVEKKSYMKDGFIFCEDTTGRVIEIQLLNLSEIKKTRSKRVA
jgi:hypothetical protein